MLQCATSVGKKEKNIINSNDSQKKARYTPWKSVFFMGVFLLSFYYLIAVKVEANASTLKEIVANKLISNDVYGPSLTLKSDIPVAERGVDVSLFDFVKGIYDENEVVSLNFEMAGVDASISISEDKSSVLFSETGIRPINIYASDKLGNETTLRLEVIVDDAPVVECQSEYYCAIGSEPDILRDSSAFDYNDGNVSDSLKLRIYKDYYNAPGDYPFMVTATDSLGLTGKAYGVVHVMEPLILQDMINTKKLGNEASVYAINPYDCGYIYENDAEKAMENNKPAVVHLFYEASRYTVDGSGYIIKITDEDVIIATNEHVGSNHSDMTVTFYNGQKATAHYVSGKSVPDIAFFKIPIESIDDFDSLGLKSVHVNLEYYNELSNNPQLKTSMYCIRGDGSEWISNYGKIVRKSGKLDTYFRGFDYPVTEVSVVMRSGVSGSAVIDAHGNLICMASFTYSHDGKTEYYGVSLNDILDYYEEVFGERLEYY